MASTALNDFISMISQLGGPSLVAVDVAWALHISAGRQLIEWLASQIGHRTIDIQDACKSLDMIALEDEEIQL